MENIFRKNLRSVRKKLRLNQDEFAKPLGIKGKTISALECGTTNPSNAVLELIEIKYLLNRNWLLTGEGDPYIKVGERGKGPECDTCIYKVGDPLDEDPVVAELLTAARKILKSGNQVARDALKRNIEYFSKAIDAEKNLSDSRAELSETKKRLNGMEDRLAKLEEALSRKKMLCQKYERGCRVRQGNIIFVKF